MPRSKLDDNDIAFFRDKMRDVTPLKKSKKKKSSTPPRTTPSPSLRPRVFIRRRFEEPEEEFPFSDQIREEVDSDTKLFFANPGLQPKTLKLLRLGAIAQTSCLDLHGTTVEEARTLLSRFLTHALKTEQRCVKIIHGRGKPEAQHPPPLLKNLVNSWLRQYPQTLAFCSTIPRDGGTGAVYVLLKRK